MAEENEFFHTDNLLHCSMELMNWFSAKVASEGKATRVLRPNPGKSMVNSFLSEGR